MILISLSPFVVGKPDPVSDFIDLPHFRFDIIGADEQFGDKAGEIGFIHPEGMGYFSLGTTGVEQFKQDFDGVVTVPGKEVLKD